MSESFHETETVGDPESEYLLFSGDQVAVLPDRYAIGARDAVKRPSGQRFSRVPLALPEVKQRAGRGFCTQVAKEGKAAAPLFRTERLDVPLRALRIVYPDIGGLAAHCQPNILLEDVRIDAVRDLPDACPFLFAEGFGHARRLVRPLHGHLITELDTGRFHGPAKGCCLPGCGRARQRDVTFGGEETGRCVQTDPSGSGQKDLGPGVKVR